MFPPTSSQRLLDGPPLAGRAEPYAAHLARLGPLPGPGRGRALVAALEASGLLGRGGAGFPVGRKWRVLADRDDIRPAVVVANGAEGEPASLKDRTLMAHRPHLVVDGAILAADAVGADEIVFYVGGEHLHALDAMRAAIRERAPGASASMHLVDVPVSYVAGEATAAVHYLNDGDARPTTTPPRMSERGVGGRPTLVQNVESLAHAALIARFGDRWYRGMGRLDAPGTALVTVSGPVRHPGVREIELGTPLAEVIDRAGGITDAVQAVIVGGYFGTWARVGVAWDLPLDPLVMRAQGLSFGCGIVGLLPARGCGVAATAAIMAFLAAESAGQCGPCVFGLRAIADAMERIAGGAARPTDLADVARWTGLVAGRGACRHPDGAAQLMASALDVFADDLRWHVRTGGCVAGASPARPA